MPYCLQNADGSVPRGGKFDIWRTASSLLRLFLAVGALEVCSARGEDSGNELASNVDPKLFGLDLPPGPVLPAHGRNVTTLDADGRLVVARLHVGIGDAAVVMLPDGQLAVRKRGEFSYTDRQFEPLGRDALARRLTATEFKGFNVKQTKRYIYFYQSSETFWFGTQSILESMFKGVMAHAKTCGIEVHEPEFPLVVVLFANQAEFQKFRRMPPEVTAYYHPLSNRVFLHEPVELSELSRDLALSQAISTVAHEGAHQILQNIGVQQRLAGWPMWINEGLAEYFAPTSVGKNLTWKGAGRINDLRMFELQRYLESRDKERPDGRMIEQTVAASKLTSAGYASAWGLTHFLIKNHKPQFSKFLREMSKVGPLEGNIAPGGDPVLANLKQFGAYFGDNLASLETQLIAYLKKQPNKDPFADLPHFMAMIVIRDGQNIRQRAELFYSSVQAERWASEEFAKIPPELQPTAFRQVKPFSNRAQAEVYCAQWLKKGQPMNQAAQ
jgi:hypothetical protein